MDLINILIGLAAGLLVGSVVVGLIIRKSLEKRSLRIIKEAEAEAEVIKKEKILQAKEKFLQLKEEHEKLINTRNSRIADVEGKLKQKEMSVSHKYEEISRKEKDVTNIKDNLSKQLAIVSTKQAELEKLHKKQVEVLETTAGMSAADARTQLMETLKDEAKTGAMSYIKEMQDEAKLTATKESKKIVIQTMQRIATEAAVENAVSVFHIENEEMKGRIIGREGRNIRALEAATGVELVVDDTPETILISCFDPMRREITRLALHQLVADGRIHPARIEDVLAKTKKQLEDEVAEVGKRTVIDLGIHGLHPELIRLVGKMKYRSSYGQNLLQHSREVANLCAAMAAEFGLNVKVTKRAGLLHDIGKVLDEDIELPHAIAGMKFAEKHNEKPDVCNAIGAHHDEIEMTTLISPVVQICDALSGARPGARRETMDSYALRLREMETLAASFDGVVKAFAIQAGRELRVLVESEKVTDKQAEEISFNISQKIQSDMTYPGQVKVIVIRETRAVNVAK